MKSELKLIALIFIMIPIAFSIYLSFDGDLLIPKGYELAIDGYVMSRTIILVFIFYSLTKLGYFILRDVKKD